MVFQLQPQLKIIIIPNTYSPTKPHMDQAIAPSPHTPTNNSSILPHTAILVPLDELVMKSYMHVQFTIVETHFHDLNVNIKNQEYWLLT
jgi:hypothetical protein